MTTPTQGQLVREWARERGYQVGIRGRLAPAIWNAYAEEHPGFEREASAGNSAICNICKRRWTGLKECHCTRCHRHFSTVDNFDAHLIDGKCADPTDERVKVKGTGLREKETVWGTIYVREGDHWKVDAADLFD